MASRSSKVPSLAVLAAVLLAATIGAGQTPSSQSRERSEAAARRAAERIRTLQREAEALVSKEGALLVELRKLEVERQLKTTELEQISRQRVEAEQQLEESRTRAASLAATVEAQQPEIARRLVRVYTMGRGGYWRSLLDVDDLRSLGRAYRTAAALSKIDRDRVVAHQRLLDSLAVERRDLEARVTQAAELEAKARAARTAVDRAVASHAGLIASIDARRDLNAQLTGELQAAQHRLHASVNQLDAGREPVVLPLRAFQGALPWPARGRLLASFGQQPSSRLGTAIVRNGIEIGVTEGQLVRAVHEGVVAFADAFTGYGTLVIVEHAEKTYSLYGHLADVQVSKGDRVEAQGPIGTSGRNPNGNPALYFELRVDGKPVDPLQWLIRTAAAQNPHSP